MKLNQRLNVSIFWIFFACSMIINTSEVYAASNAQTKTTKKSSKTSNGNGVKEKTEDIIKKEAGTTTIIESDLSDNAEKSEGEDTVAAPVERLFRSPVLSSGLASGADAINRSIESLMESLFYNSMDNDIRHDLTGSASVGLSLHRDVLQAESGAWVVIDRMGIGPMYGKELYRFNDVPVTLGASQSTDVYDIYLRTDPMRVNESSKLPFWRTAVNNWFGILPLLEAVLPPSFNTNELYDPLRRVEAPFTFPLSIAAFEGMDSGTIKSYALNGGINLGLELAKGIHGYKDVLAEGSSGIDVHIPYTIFRTGQYRVNVLKKDLNTAWVGLTDTTRNGHRIETKIGKTYYLISKTIPYWKGLAAPFFPIDIGVEEAISDMFGRVYEFDLRKEEAQKAYLEAVHGNLAAAQLSWLRKREDKLDTGVTFFYTKKEKRYETLLKTGQNVFIYNKSTQRNHSDAEIEITDREGRFYILESRQDEDLSKWDILTGSANSTYSAVSDIRVRKVVEKDDKSGREKTRFEFVAEANPVETTMTLRTIDKFVETEDLRAYLKELGRFTAIDLISQLPEIPIRDSDLQELRRKQATFTSDISTPKLLHTTPTHLGSFEGYASVHFTTEDLNRAVERNNEDMWSAFCSSFGVSVERCQSWQESTLSRNLDRTVGWIVFPMKLFDVRFPRLDAVDEIEDAMQALRSYYRSTDPETKRNDLRRLLNTEHPLELTEAILNLAGIDNVARNVQLGTKPKGNGPDSAKNLFKSINGKRFHRGPKTPKTARYDSTLDIESQFNPANLKFLGVKPRIRKITLFRENSDLETKSSTPQISARLYGAKIRDAKDVQIYVRIEQTGQIQLAKFKLAEQVFEIPLTESAIDFSADTNNYLIRLSGPQSVMSSMLLSEAFSLGGDFKVTFAISTNGAVWSDEKALEFRIEDGRLLPTGT